MRARGLSLGDRVGFWSGYLWGATVPVQKLSGFGKAPEIEDTMPLLGGRFDCTTFVETVAALVQTGRPEMFFNNLKAIRYRDGVATFENRNHFPEADWIPNNEKAGILKDVTAQIAQSGGVTVATTNKRIERAKWLAQQEKQGKVSRSIASVVEKKWPATIDAKVSYIALKDISKIKDKIPTGTILNLVRKNDDKHPVLITHQGFIVRQKGAIVLQHASQGGAVRTMDLSDYLEKQSKESIAWPLVGINLNQLTGG
jgi:hypothetical protein